MAEAEDFKITLAAARVNAGITQRDAAKSLHVVPKTLCDWEKGRVRIGYDMVVKMSDLYHIPIDKLNVLDPPPTIRKGKSTANSADNAEAAS